MIVKYCNGWMVWRARHSWDELREWLNTSSDRKRDLTPRRDIGNTTDSLQVNGEIDYPTRWKCDCFYSLFLSFSLPLSLSISPVLSPSALISLYDGRFPNKLLNKAFSVQVLADLFFASFSIAAIGVFLCDSVTPLRFIHFVSICNFLWFCVYVWRARTQEVHPLVSPIQLFMDSFHFLSVMRLSSPFYMLLLSNNSQSISVWLRFDAMGYFVCV